MISLKFKWGLDTTSSWCSNAVDVMVSYASLLPASPKLLLNCKLTHHLDLDSILTNGKRTNHLLWKPQDKPEGSGTAFSSSWSLFLKASTHPHWGLFLTPTLATEDSHNCRVSGGWFWRGCAIFSPYWAVVNLLWFSQSCWGPERLSWSCLPIRPNSTTVRVAAEPPPDGLGVAVMPVFHREGGR